MTNKHDPHMNEPNMKEFLFRHRRKIFGVLALCAGFYFYGTIGALELGKIMLLRACIQVAISFPLLLLFMYSAGATRGKNNRHDKYD
jgi:hypothetical protein